MVNFNFIYKQAAVKIRSLIIKTSCYLMDRPLHNVAHIAIPTHDKQLAKNFYIEGLGSKLAREYDDRITLNFFDHQLVCHLSPELEPTDSKVNPFANVYPRHFGMTLLREEDLHEVHERLQSLGWKHLQPIMTRFGDLPERHLTFFAADPTHNIVEFKWYEDSIFAY